MKSSPLRASVLTGLIAVYALIRLVFWFSAEAGGDEAYYWVWGQHPGLSYYDHPPVLAWVQGLFAWLFGQSTFVLRLPNLLTTIAIFYFYYRIVQRLYADNRRAQFIVTALTLAASPLLTTFMAQAIMDHLLIMLLLAVTCLMVFYLEDYADGKSPALWRLYAGALLLGLAGITKYNAVFLAVGIGLAVLLHPKLRPLLRGPHIYLAALVTLLMLSPVVIWNVQHDFASFRYHLVERNVDAEHLRVHLDAFVGFVAGTILVLSPFTVWLAIRRFFVDSKLKARDWFRFADRSVYSTVALLTFLTGTGLFLSRSLFNYTLLYWNIPAYLLLLPLLGKALLDDDGRLRRKKLFIGQQVYGITLAALVAFNYAILPLDTWSRQGAGEQGTRHWYGWEQTAAALREEMKNNTSGKPLLLMTTNHHLAGALGFTMNRSDIVAVSSRHDQYDMWWDDSGYAGRDALVVYDDWNGMNDEVLSLFERAGPVRKVPITKFGYPIKTMYIQRVYHYRGKKKQP